MRLRRVTEQRLERLQDRYAALAQRLARVHPGNKLQQQSVRLVELEARLKRATELMLARMDQRLKLAQRGLDAISPLATIERGYAIVTGPDGTVLQDAADVKPGDAIEARLRRGVLRATVTGAKD